MDIAVADGHIVGVRGRAATGSTAVGWGRRISSAGRRTTPPTASDAARPARRDWSTDWDTAMTLVAERSRTLLDSDGPGAIGFYTTGQLFAEEYYTLTTIARAGIGTNHLDGNTRLCTATAGEALEGELRLRRTARLLHRRRPRRRDRAVRAQRRRDADGAVDRGSWTGSPAPRRRSCWWSTRAGPRWPNAPPCTCPASGYQSRAAERAAARTHRARPGRPRLPRPAHCRLRRTGSADGGLHR